MNARECLKRCEKCKFFSIVDPHESEQFCQAKGCWIDPAEYPTCLTFIDKSRYPSDYSIRLFDSLDDIYKKFSHVADSLEKIAHQIDIMGDRIIELEKAHGCEHFCGNCIHYTPPKSSVLLPLCALSGDVIDPDDSSCVMWESSLSSSERKYCVHDLKIVSESKQSNQLDSSKELFGKPDREECQNCPKPQCDNCHNYPF